MSYTTVDLVAEKFPTFKRGIPQQNPADSYIQNEIDEVAAEIDAALQRRFQEAMSSTGFQGNFAGWVASLSQDAQNLLEKINTHGAAGHLGRVFAAFGFTALAKLATDYHEEYDRLLNELNNLDDKGAPRKQETGIYDHLFDSEAATPGPRPQLGGVAGGEEPHLPVHEEGMSNYFGKFDKRGR